MSGLDPEVLYFQQSPGDTDAAGQLTTLWAAGT